jgi:hypothetical protein
MHTFLMHQTPQLLLAFSLSASHSPPYHHRRFVRQSSGIMPVHPTDTLQLQYNARTPVKHLSTALCIFMWNLFRRDFARRSGGHLVVHGDLTGRGVALLNKLFGYAVQSLGTCGVRANTTGNVTAFAALNGAVLDQYGSAGTPFAQVPCCDCTRLDCVLLFCCSYHSRTRFESRLSL